MRALAFAAFIASARSSPCDERGATTLQAAVHPSPRDGYIPATGDVTPPGVYNGGPRELLTGETDPEEGMTDRHSHLATVETLPDLIRSFAGGDRYKVRLELPGGGRDNHVGFLLWLPPNFHNATEAWPVVFHLHGRGEGTTFADNSTVGDLVHHGLPHKLSQRRHFSSRFVLVAPQVQTPVTVGDEYSWAMSIPLMDRMRAALFANVHQLDRQRAYLTGLSIGGTGVWAWAVHNLNHGEQPWAAIAPTSALWPNRLDKADTRPFHVIEERLLRGLAQMNIRIAHCANDATMPIFLGTTHGPRCYMCDPSRLNNAEEENDSVKCGASADAIVEGLMHYGADNNVQYDRIEFCHPSQEPTDSSFVPTFACYQANKGHDAWRQLYASREFPEWLLARRLR